MIKECGIKVHLPHHVTRYSASNDIAESADFLFGSNKVNEGKLYSEEHNRSFTIERVSVQTVKAPADKTKLSLVINRHPIDEWFREQFDRLRQTIRQLIYPQRKSKGITYTYIRYRITSIVQFNGGYYVSFSDMIIFARFQYYAYSFPYIPSRAIRYYQQGA